MRIVKKEAIRFGGWWAAFAGLYGASSVCPFCGQAGCPVGAAGAVGVGAVMALAASALRRPARPDPENNKPETKTEEAPCPKTASSAK